MSNESINALGQTQAYLMACELGAQGLCFNCGAELTGFDANTSLGIGRKWRLEFRFFGVPVHRIIISAGISSALSGVVVQPVSPLANYQHTAIRIDYKLSACWQRSE
jgi:hypothetical protein